MRDAMSLTDRLDRAAGFRRDPGSGLHIRGTIEVRLLGPGGELKLEAIVPNLVTQVGDQYYAERAAGIAGAPAAPTGMQLGTDATAPAKTGVGAALVTLVANSLVALAGPPASSLNAGKRRLSYSASWGAGVATANNIQEIVLVNQATTTQTAAPAAATISRGLLSPIVNKGAADTLAVTWHHDLGS